MTDLRFVIQKAIIGLAGSQLDSGVLKKRQSHTSARDLCILAVPNGCA